MRAILKMKLFLSFLLISVIITYVSSSPAKRYQDEDSIVKREIDSEPHTHEHNFGGWRHNHNHEGFHHNHGQGSFHHNHNHNHGAYLHHNHGAGFHHNHGSGRHGGCGHHHHDSEITTQIPFVPDLPTKTPAHVITTTSDYEEPE